MNLYLVTLSLSILLMNSNIWASSSSIGMEFLQTMESQHSFGILDNISLNIYKKVRSKSYNPCLNKSVMKNDLLKNDLLMLNNTNPVRLNRARLRRNDARLLLNDHNNSMSYIDSILKDMSSNYSVLNISVNINPVQDNPIHDFDSISSISNHSESMSENGVEILHGLWNIE